MRWLKRAALPLTAQILFTLAQVSITIAGSATMRPDDWGRFAMLLSVFFIAMSLVRGFSSVPVLVFLSGAVVLAWEPMGGSRLGGGLVATPAWLPSAATGVAIDAVTAGSLLGISIVSYTLYDCARAVELAAGRFGRIVVSDGVVLSALVAGCGCSFVPGAHASAILPAAMLASYALGAWVLSLGRRPTERWTLRMFLAEYRRDGPFLAIDGVLLASVLGSFVIVIGIASSLTQAGAFRTCLALLVGPLQAVQTSLAPLAIRSLRRAAKERGEAPDSDSRFQTLGQPGLFVAAGLTSGAAYGVVATLVASLLVSMIDLPVIETALPYAFAGSMLVSSLWSSSVFSSFMRYRRPNSELTVIRLITLTMSLGSFATMTIALGTGLPAALLVGSIPLVLVPAAHAALRWRPVARSFAAPTKKHQTDAQSQPALR